MIQPKRFNVRVYGLCIQNGGLLVSEEKHHQTNMRKFPGGGLEFGEGLVECLKREWQEELEVEIAVDGDIFYANEFFVQSRFNPAEQVLALFYKVHLLHEPGIQLCPEGLDFDTCNDGDMAFRFLPLNQLSPDMFTFPADQAAVERILNKN
ncbi:MAG: NUDIX domain-containing protein [Bacteroidia bacterium]